MKKRYIILIIIALILIIGTFFIIYKKTRQDSILEISGYFDETGNQIASGEQSVIGGVEGVHYITLDINVQNKDTTTLDLKIINAEPTAFSDALESTTLEVLPDEYATWTTNLIDITPFEGTEQEFTITIEANSPIRQLLSKTATLTIKVEEDPVADFGVEVTSEINNDDPVVDPPDEEPEEELTFNTNAIDGNYKDSDVWIKVDDITYWYKGYSSYSCLTENNVVLTPEGYPVCTRPSYDITSRVYLDTGSKGLIFKNI